MNQVTNMSKVGTDRDECVSLGGRAVREQVAARPAAAPYQVEDFFFMP